MRVPGRGGGFDREFDGLGLFCGQSVGRPYFILNEEGKVNRGRGPVGAAGFRGCWHRGTPLSRGEAFERRPVESPSMYSRRLAGVVESSINSAKLGEMAPSGPR